MTVQTVQMTVQQKKAAELKQAVKDLLARSAPVEQIPAVTVHDLFACGGTATDIDPSAHDDPRARPIHERYYRVKATVTERGPALLQIENYRIERGEFWCGVPESHLYALVQMEENDLYRERRAKAERKFIDRCTRFVQERLFSRGRELSLSDVEMLIASRADEETSKLVDEFNAGTEYSPEGEFQDEHREPERLLVDVTVIADLGYDPRLSQRQRESLAKTMTEAQAPVMEKIIEQNNALLEQNKLFYALFERVLGSGNKGSKQ